MIKLKSIIVPRAVILITAVFVFCGCKPHEKSTTSSQLNGELFKQISAERESFIGGLPNSPKGYNYSVKLSIEQNITINFDSLIIDAQTYTVRVVKGNALCFSKHYLKGDTITIRATQNIDNLTKTNNIVPVVKLKYSSDNLKGLVNYYTITNLQSKTGKPRQ